jgi:hypothetical protein
MAEIIPSFNDFQKIIEILNTIFHKINAETDVEWTQFSSAAALIDELTVSIEKLGQGDHQTLENIYVMFLPTGSFQELFDSNGWADEYLQLAEEFDACYEKLKKE